MLAVLRSKQIAALDFTLDGRKVMPSMYEDVAKAVDARTITVMVDKVSKDGPTAAYFYEMKTGDKTIFYDVMTIRMSELSTASNAARFSQ